MQKLLNFQKKILIGRFSSVNTRLVFDTNMLVPNLKSNNETIKKDIKIGYKIMDEKMKKKLK